LWATGASALEQMLLRLDALLLTLLCLFISSVIALALALNGCCTCVPPVAGATPAATAGMETPAAAALQRIQQQVPMTPEQYQEMRTQREMYERNKPLTDEELDGMLPGEKEGYKVCVRASREGPGRGQPHDARRL
jgi:hypothetical protein